MKPILLYADVSSLGDAGVFHTLYEAVSPERREKIDRCRREADRRLSLGAEALLTLALREVGVAVLPRVAVGEYGKPYFPEMPSLHFNLSHAGERVLCCVADRPVGCDAERIGAGHLRVADRYFASDEAKYVRAGGDAALCARRFCRVWTRKESLVKAEGTGIATLPSFSVLPDRVPCGGGTAQIRTYDPGDGYLYSVCLCDEGEIEMPELEKRELVTLR